MSTMNSEERNNFKLTRFMIISAAKLEMTDLGLATACKIYKKFFAFCQSDSLDQYLVATSCLFLAVKIEEQDTIHLRDILNVCYRTRHTEMLPLELNDKYWSLRNSVTQTELLVVRALGFRLNFDHPHKYLLQYLDSIKAWIDPENIVFHSYVPQVSWQCLRDSLYSDLTLKFRSQGIAISIIYFVSLCYGVNISQNSKPNVNWWQALDEKTDLNVISSIINELVTIYRKEAEFRKDILLS